VAAAPMVIFVETARRSMRPASSLDDAARLKGTSDVARSVWPTATHKGKLTGRRLVITFVPTTGWKLVAIALVVKFWPVRVGIIGLIAAAYWTRRAGTA
jgi:hypothetical protein